MLRTEPVFSVSALRVSITAKGSKMEGDGVRSWELGGARYWICTDGLPGMDFNRQIVEPGVKDGFPDGLVAIYVDDDFWCVAVLPLDQYRDVSVEKIVAEHWPHYADDATYAPDHGTTDQLIYQLRADRDSERKRHDWLWEEFRKMEDENKRLKRGRTDVAPRGRTRHEMSVNYFVRQYEHLLTAVAHENVPRTDLPGVCSICNLLGTDRVHMGAWITKHDAGYAPSLDWAGSYADEPAIVD